eukprot:364700-Chlamydomonas_euryale.AAC.7
MDTTEQVELERIVMYYMSCNRRESRRKTAVWGLQLRQFKPLSTGSKCQRHRRWNTHHSERPQHVILTHTQLPTMRRHTASRQSARCGARARCRGAPRSALATRQRQCRQALVQPPLTQRPPIWRRRRQRCDVRRPPRAVAGSALARQQQRQTRRGWQRRRGCSACDSSGCTGSGTAGEQPSRRRQPVQDLLSANANIADGPARRGSRMRRGEHRVSVLGAHIERLGHHKQQRTLQRRTQCVCLIEGVSSKETQHTKDAPCFLLVLGVICSEGGNFSVDMCVGGREVAPLISLWRYAFFIIHVQVKEMFV